jgi:hypothetical protein
MAVLAFRRNGVTVTESAISAEPAGSAFAIYSESSGPANQAGAVRTGVAIANPSASPVVVNLTLSRLDGSAPLAQASLTIPAAGQVAKFIHELLPGLPAEFRGVLRMTAASPVAVSGLRSRYNERGDFLITTTPPWNEQTPARAELIFPHIPSGGGYSTQLVLIGPSGAGELWLKGQDGSLLPGQSLVDLN